MARPPPAAYGQVRIPKVLTGRSRATSQSGLTSRGPKRCDDRGQALAVSFTSGISAFYFRIDRAGERSRGRCAPGRRN
jgi:hypothetical protein